MPVKPRPLPAETVDGLRPPRVGFPYFAHADRFLFDTIATECSPVNAWWLADACFLVYGDSDFIEDEFRKSPLPAQAWQLAWLGLRDDNRGMVLSHDDALVIVFRGTRIEVHDTFNIAEFVLINQDDLWTDSQFLPTVWKDGGEVHAGFLGALTEVSSALDTFVQDRRPSQQLYLTGHSLGGVLASLAAAQIGPAEVHGVYTYGCPRVGDKAFAAAISAARNFRFVYGDDWVPTMPPKFLGYEHAGTRQSVPGGPTGRFWDEVAAATGDLFVALTKMATQLRLGVGDLPFRISGLVDHAPIYYATLLWNALLAETSQKQSESEE